MSLYYIRRSVLVSLDPLGSLIMVGYDISYDHLVGWEADLRLLTERVAAGLFTRPEPRATFADLVRGLLADVPRKNSWQLAEHVGHGSACRLEWLLDGAKWDADALRDRVRDYVVATPGCRGRGADRRRHPVIKKGDKSVGVAPQHCGATGQTENCQVMPMLSLRLGARARVHRPGVVPAPASGPTIRSGARPPGCPPSAGSSPSPSW